jgi:error-prone DNA polymerase
MKSFTHLRVASGYSFKYGTAHPHQLVARAAEFGMKSLALTDRDGMAGAIRFTKECESAGIAPILGVNLSFLQKKFRITLLAQQGHLDSLYKLLTAIKMNSQESILTHEILERFAIYSRNVLILHGPLSPLADAIAHRRPAQALSIYNSTRDLFAESAIECISHQARDGSLYSTTFAGRALAFARDNNLPAILTNAVRMLDRSDGPVADVLDSARHLLPLHPKNIERTNSEAYLKEATAMHRIADEIARAAGERGGRALLATTADWAERSALSPRRDVGIGEMHLPEPSVVGASNRADLSRILRERCEAGLAKKYSGSLSVKAQERLEDELATISALGFGSYFLTVADITDMARARGIRVAARGSGAGSLVCHVLGISGVEPLSQDLLMERFCSTLRGELPDIDIDVESARRLEIYDAIFQRYGDPHWSNPGNSSRCATVSMVETYRARHAIRDVGAALGIAPMEIDLIAKSLPHIRAKNIGAALSNLPELKSLKLDTPLLQTAIELAAKLDGLPRHLSMHPCAIALSDIGLRDHSPIMESASGYPMLEWDKDDVEAIGLLKLDVLGVRMQSAISFALEEVKRVEGDEIDIDAIALDDRLTFDLIKSTRTLGIFQIESPGQRELVGKMAPDTFTDLIIDISLFRPGPVKSDMITPFLNFRHGLHSRAQIHPDLEDILSQTQGVVVFHEQVIRIIACLTGCTLAQADESRRLLGSREGQQEVCDWFFSTAIANGYEQSVVERVWDILRAFASFGFCKAHAAAFALPTYQSAWLKTHHTAAFLAGVMTHDPGMYPKRLIADEAKQWGIILAPLDINLSDRVHRVERTNLLGRVPICAPDVLSSGASLQLPDARGYAIRLSLMDVAAISEREVNAIIAGRPYVDLADFVYRGGTSRPVTESLIMVGAFDQLHQLGNSELNRRDLLLHLHDLYRSHSSSKSSQNASSSQMLLELAPPKLAPSGLPDLTASEEVAHEIEILNMDITHHALEFYSDFLNHIGAIKSSDLIKARAGSTVLVAGVKVALQTPPVRSGRRVMFLSIDDGHGCSDLTFFEDVQNSYASLLRSSSLFLVQGVLRRTGPRGVSIRATAAWELAESYEKWRNLGVMEKGLA